MLIACVLVLDVIGAIALCVYIVRVFMHSGVGRREKKFRHLMRSRYGVIDDNEDQADMGAAAAHFEKRTRTYQIYVPEAEGPVGSIEVEERVLVEKGAK
jgi:hypothetical protein